MRILLLIALLGLSAGRAGAQVPSALAEGVQALEAGRLEMAQTLLHRAERQHPRDPLVLASLSRLYATAPLTDRSRAVAYARRGLLRHPNHPELLRARLRLALADSGSARFERMETLRTLSRRLLALDPHDPDALLACGISGYDDLAWRLGSGAVSLTARGLQARYERGADCLDVLLAATPDDAAARRLRLRFAFLIDRPRDAAQVVDALLLTDSGSTDLWRWRGLAAHLDADPVTAVEGFNRAWRLASPEERLRWQDPALLRVPGAPPVAAERFWQSLDPLMSTPDNERWTEHMARLTLADLFFEAEGGTASARGRLLVRYGLPANVVEALSGYGAFVSPEEGRLVNWDYGDFHLVLQDWFMSGVFKFYSPPARAFSGRDAPNDYVLIARALERDLPERMVMGQVDELAPVTSYAFREGEREGAEVVTAVAPRGPESVRVFGVGAGRTTEGAVISTSAAYVLHRLQLAPGSYRLQAEQKTNSGWAVRQDSIRVAPRTDALSMSSLVPAALVEEGGSSPGAFERHGHGIVPAPTGGFRQGTPIYLYVEFYGLRPEGTFSVEIEADQTERGTLWRRKAPGVAVRFSEHATAATEARYYVLDTADLGAGRHHIRLTLRDVLGRTDEVSCTVVIEPPS